MGAFLSKKLTHNMGPFVRKFPCRTYNGAFCSLKFCLYIFFFQTYLNSSSFFIFFNFPGGATAYACPPPPPPAGAHAFDACATLIHALIGSNSLLYNIADAKVEVCKKCRIKQRAISQGRLAETTLLPCLSSYTG